MVRYAIVANVGLAFVPVCPVLSTDCDSRNLLIILIVHCVEVKQEAGQLFIAVMLFLLLLLLFL